MITTRCPFCANEIRIPDSILGKKVRCKNTACQQAFTAAAAETAQPVAAALAPSFAPHPAAPAYAPVPAPDPAVEWDTPSEPDYATPAQERPTTRGKSRGKSPISEARYPNLTRWLKWLRSILEIQLALELVGAAMVVMATIYEAFTKNVRGSETLFGIAVGIGFAVGAYTFFVACMAVIELAYVVIDIEANTRRVADSGE